MHLRGAPLAALAFAVSLAATPAAALEPWTAVGPAGSVVKSLLAVPGSPAMLFAGTPTGVFRSADGGTTWVPTGLVNVDVNVVVGDPVTPSTLYAGTVAGTVFRSIDGG